MVYAWDESLGFSYDKKIAGELLVQFFDKLVMDYPRYSSLAKTIAMAANISKSIGRLSPPFIPVYIAPIKDAIEAK